MQYARTLYGAQHDNDFPHFIMYSLPTPFFPQQPINDRKMQEALAIGIEALNTPELGIDYIVIPCNIAHKYYDAMAAQSSVPILNIVTNTLQQLPVLQQSIALLATQSTIDSHIYQDQLKQHGYQIFYDTHLQSQVNHLLTELKAHSLSQQARNQWHDIVAYLHLHHCSTVLVACTDLSPCIALDATLSFVDSSDVLARMTIEKYVKLSKSAT